jgi:hypothetical protein
LLDRALGQLDPSRFDASLDGAIACRPIVETLNQLAGQPNRFAPVDLKALALAQIPDKSGVEKILRDLASDPVVVAVAVGALRYVNRKTRIPRLIKKITRLVARLNQNGRK